MGTKEITFALMSLKTKKSHVKFHVDLLEGPLSYGGYVSLLDPTEKNTI